jgi:hypothetical protein
VKEVPDPKQVDLNPCFYFHKGGCKRRNGLEWVHAYSPVLKPEVYSWLRENVGFERNELREVDRVYYPGEKIPDLKANREWHRLHQTEFEVVYADENGKLWGMGEELNRYSHNSHMPNIWFPTERKADRFRERFSLWLTNYSLMRNALKGWRVNDYVAEVLGQLDRELYAALMVRGGMRGTQGGEWNGFLAASAVNPRDNQYYTIFPVVSKVELMKLQLQIPAGVWYEVHHA